MDSRELISEIFQKFSTEEPITIQILRDGDRLIAEIVTSRQSYFLKGEQQSASFIDNLIKFVNEMISKGLPFVTFEKTNDGLLFIESKGMIFTLERKSSGREVEQLQLSHIRDIGRSLGRQHAVSSILDFRFGSGTSWGMFGGNGSDALGDYDENELSFNGFRSEVEGIENFAEEFILIKKLYIEKREKLSNIWEILPTGPVQGDFCPYNMLFHDDGTISSIYDFNIAGNEVFLNECIGIGVFLSWHYGFNGNESESERFWNFIQAYESERPFTKQEWEHFDDLFAIIRAFRYDRVEKGAKLLRSGNAGDFIRETCSILEGSYKEGIIGK